MISTEKAHKNLLNSICSFLKNRNYTFILGKQSLTDNNGHKVGFDYPSLQIGKLENKKDSLNNARFKIIHDLSEIPEDSFYLGSKEDCYYEDRAIDDEDDELELFYPYMYQNYLAIDLKISQNDVRDLIFFVNENALDSKQEVLLLGAILTDSFFNLKTIVDMNDSSKSGMQSELKTLEHIDSMDSFVLKQSLKKNHLLTHVDLFKNKTSEYKVRFLNFFKEKKDEDNSGIPYEFKDFVFSILKDDLSSIKEVAKKHTFLMNFLNDFKYEVSESEINYRKIDINFHKELYMMNREGWHLKEYETFFSSSLIFVKDYLVNKSHIQTNDLETSIKYQSMDIYFNSEKPDYLRKLLHDTIHELRTNKMLGEGVVFEKRHEVLEKFLDMWFLNNNLNKQVSSKNIRRKI